VELGDGGVVVLRELVLEDGNVSEELVGVVLGP
jgi:hypothetical protein